MLDRYEKINKELSEIKDKNGSLLPQRVELDA